MVEELEGVVVGDPYPSPEDIEAGKSPKGGWTRARLAQWGVPWPPPKGWKHELEVRYWAKVAVETRRKALEDLDD